MRAPPRLGAAGFIVKVTQMAISWLNECGHTDHPCLQDINQIKAPLTKFHASHFFREGNQAADCVVNFGIYKPFDNILNYMIIYGIRLASPGSPPTSTNDNIEKDCKKK